MGKDIDVRQKVIQTVMAVIFLCGLLIFLYPKATEWYAAYKNQKAITSFEESKKSVKNVTEQQTPSVTQLPVDNKRLDELQQDMLDYNERLYREGQKELKDPFDFEEPSFVLKDYGIEQEVFATIEIPAMEVKLPLYLGATKENMTKGGAILGQTSMPLGGKNTNVVIAAHRGYRGISMFREIEKLKEGDLIEITTLFDTLTYQVSRCKIIEPDQINEILIQPGEDMITLLTCHPYTKNTHRYLVFAKRCENIAKSEETDKAEKGKEQQYIPERAEDVEKEISGHIIWMEKYIPLMGIIVIFLLIVGGIIVTR